MHDVNDPKQLAKELMPHLRRMFEQFQSEQARRVESGMAIAIKELPGVVSAAYFALLDVDIDAAIEFNRWLVEVVCGETWIDPMSPTVEAKSEPIDPAGHAS